MVGTLISCSNDDNQVATTPFEGQWKVENILYPDNDIETNVAQKSMNNVSFSTVFSFTQNEYKILDNGNVLSQGTYTFDTITNDDFLNYSLKLINSDNVEGVFLVRYSSSNSMTLIYPTTVYELSRVN